MGSRYTLDEQWELTYEQLKITEAKLVNRLQACRAEARRIGRIHASLAEISAVKAAEVTHVPGYPGDNIVRLLALV